MINFLKYKNITLIFLITTFSIFNFGLPITIHYCKMMQSYATDRCSMCHETETNNTLKITQSLEQCCNVKVLDTNKNAFIQNQSKELIKFQLVILLTFYNIDKAINKIITYNLTNLKIIIPIKKLSLSILNLSILI